MSYTYCPNCHDAICMCGEKYKGMDAEDLTTLITLLTDLRDKRVVLDNTPTDPEKVRAFVRQQQADFRSKNPLPRR